MEAGSEHVLDTDDTETSVLCCSLELLCASHRDINILFMATIKEIEDTTVRMFND